MKLFLSQTQLENWITSDVADLVGQDLLIKVDGTTFPTQPAVHVLKVVSGSDSKKLVGKVKSEDQLAQLQAERLAASCIVDDTAYETVEGYVVAVEDSEPDGKHPGPGPSSPEADLLAAFILD